MSTSGQNSLLIGRKMRACSKDTGKKLSRLCPCDISMDLKSFFGTFRKYMMKMETSILNFGTDLWGTWEKEREHLLWGSKPITSPPWSHRSPAKWYVLKPQPSEKPSLFSLKEKLIFHPLNSQSFSSSLYFVLLPKQLSSASTLAGYLTWPDLILILTLQGRYY